MSVESLFGACFYLLPLIMGVTGLILIFIAALHNQPGWVKVSAVLKGLLLPVAAVLVFYDVLILAVVCSPVLVLPGLLLLYLGAMLVYEQRM